jgi:hypothetical protein
VLRRCSAKQVWKTRMGRFRSEGAIEAFKNVYSQGGGARCVPRNNPCGCRPRRRLRCGQLAAPACTRRPPSAPQIRRRCRAALAPLRVVRPRHTAALSRTRSTLPSLAPRHSAFWAGLDAKLFESATKGAILMCVARAHTRAARRRSALGARGGGGKRTFCSTLALFAGSPRARRPVRVVQALNTRR